MSKRNHRRFTVWTDETMWGKDAMESGLCYGVYDHDKGDTGDKCSKEEQGGIITSWIDASEKAEELNLVYESTTP